MENFNINRRHFLKGAAAAIAMSAYGAKGIDLINPQKPLRVGLIGTGWYGKSDLFRLMQVAPVEVAGLCDVDRRMLDDAEKRINERQKSKRKIPKYGDYRKMLSNEQFDIVLIGTPDHWHALQAIESIKNGANLYLQKPISVDVIEGEAIVAATKKYNRVVQVGLQRRSTPHLIEAKQSIVDAGLLGKVSHVEMCCYYHMRADRNPPVVPVPDYLDYEMWTGPAPLRPYDGLPHRSWWRAMMEYGNGIMGDMCVHMFDAVRWMLDLDWPNKISSTGGIYVQKDSKANISDTQSAIFEYDDLNCLWEHRSWGTAADPEYPWSFKIYGENGTLSASVNKFDFTPVDRSKEKVHGDVLFEREKYPEDLKEKDIELHVASATRGHMIDFLAAIDKQQSPAADIESSHISTASCIMANISMDLGRPLVYDPKTMTIPGDEEATRLLARAYRSPWQHPHPKDFK